MSKQQERPWKELRPWEKLQTIQAPENAGFFATNRDELELAHRQLSLRGQPRGAYRTITGYQHMATGRMRKEPGRSSSEATEHGVLAAQSVLNCYGDYYHNAVQSIHDLNNLANRLAIAPKDQKLADMLQAIDFGAEEPGARVTVAPFVRYVTLKGIVEEHLGDTASLGSIQATENRELFRWGANKQMGDPFTRVHPKVSTHTSRRIATFMMQTSVADAEALVPEVLDDQSLRKTFWEVPLTEVSLVPTHYGKLAKGILNGGYFPEERT